MKNIIIIILTWIVALPVMFLLGSKAVEVWLEPYMVMACILFTGMIGGCAAIITSEYVIKYKASDYKVKLEDVYSVFFYTAAAGLVVALVGGILSMDIIVYPALCVFAVSGIILFLMLLVEMLLRKN